MSSRSNRIQRGDSPRPISHLAMLVPPSPSPPSTAVVTSDKIVALPHVTLAPAVVMGQLEEHSTSRLEQACTGKLRSEGGLNLSELRSIATERGIIGADSMLRSELQHLLCLSSAPEVAPIEHLPIDAFRRMYPKEHVLGAGSFGEVYSSGDFAVKTQEIKGYASIVELDFYASVFHPCILRPVAWSIDHEYIYIVMPKGKSVGSALADGSVTMYQFVSDTLSAIAFLNVNGFAHRDIKPENMIVHENRVKIIDFGLAGRAQLFSDGNYYHTGHAYTEVYRDPEYDRHSWNSIKSEIYALAKSYHDSEVGNRWELNNLYSFSSPDPLLNWIFTEAKKFDHERPTIQELIASAPDGLIVRTYTGARLDTPVIRFNHYCGERYPIPVLSKVFGFVSDWLIGIANDKKFTARSLFTALHLLHRTLPKVHPDYHTNQKRLFAFASICLHLAIIVNEQLYVPTDTWIEWCGKFKIENFLTEYPLVLAGADFIISGVTPWDYASCAEDLIEMLDDIVSCDYDPNRTHILRNTGNTKNITATRLLELWSANHEIHGAEARVTYFKGHMKDERLYQTSAKVHPVTEILERPSWMAIQKNWTLREKIPRARIGMVDGSVSPPLTVSELNTIIHNREALIDGTSLIDAQAIYYLLLSNTEKYGIEIVHRLCKFNVRRTGMHILLVGRLNPFTATQEMVNAVPAPRRR